MKNELKFLRRLLTVSKDRRGYYGGIFRKCGILPDGRWASTDGCRLIVLTPPESLAALRTELAMPLDVLIDGAKRGMVPEIDGAWLRYSSGDNIFMDSAFPKAGNILRTLEAVTYTTDAIAMVSAIRMALDGAEAAHPMTIASRHEHRGSGESVPARAVSVTKTALLAVWEDGFSLPYTIHPAALSRPKLPSFGLIESGDRIGKQIAALPYWQLAEALKGAKTATLHFRGPMQPIAVERDDEFHLIMPSRY